MVDTVDDVDVMLCSICSISSIILFVIFKTLIENISSFSSHAFFNEAIVSDKECIAVRSVGSLLLSVGDVDVVVADTAADTSLPAALNHDVDCDIISLPESIPLLWKKAISMVCQYLYSSDQLPCDVSIVSIFQIDRFGKRFINVPHGESPVSTRR